jgi:hypothetical protein
MLSSRSTLAYRLQTLAKRFDANTTRRRHSNTWVKEFVQKGHKIWDWRYNEEEQQLLHLQQNSTMDVYTPSQIPGFERRPNCWTRTATCDALTQDNDVICSVKEINVAVMALCSYACLATNPPLPETFWDILVSWGCTWFWDQVQLIGDTNWLITAIGTNSCIAVADGSYMREITNTVCSTAFFFENTVRSCKVVGAFPEQSETANAYREELLGLMAIHLLLLAVNKVAPHLDGSIIIYSDCERALGSIESLPTLKIPTKYKHADILKNILVNCTNLSFRIDYQHISAHQDEGTSFHLLSRPAQLNCAADAGTKRQIRDLDLSCTLCQQRFPLEPIVCFAGTWKLTPSMSWFMQFYAHK